MSETKREWLSGVLRKPRERLLYEQERLILVCQEAVARAMEESGVSQAEVARRIGRNRSFITHALSTGRNLTLKTLAALLWATGMRLEVELVPYCETEQGDTIHVASTTTATEYVADEPESSETPAFSLDKELAA